MYFPPGTTARKLNNRHSLKGVWDGGVQANVYCPYTWAMQRHMTLMDGKTYWEQTVSNENVAWWNLYTSHTDSYVRGSAE